MRGRTRGGGDPRLLRELAVTILGSVAIQDDEPKERGWEMSDCEGMCQEGGEGCMPDEMVDRMVEVATGCDAMTQALECLHTAVKADRDGGLSFVEGMLEVLLFTAAHVQTEAQTLVEEAGRMGAA